MSESKTDVLLAEQRVNDKQFKDAVDVCTEDFCARIVKNDPTLIEIQDFMNDTEVYLTVLEARRLREWLEKVIP